MIAAGGGNASSTGLVGGTGEHVDNRRKDKRIDQQKAENESLRARLGLAIPDPAPPATAA